jgi:hypothetical protein
VAGTACGSHTSSTRFRLTDTQWGNRPNFVIDDRLVWLFVIPNAKFPITGGTCRSDCFFRADMAVVVDATSGRWLTSLSLGS